MLPDWVSNPGPLTYESGALPIALRGPAYVCMYVCAFVHVCFCVIMCVREYVYRSTCVLL